MHDRDAARRPQREDYQQALQSMATYVDVTVDDLMTLTRRAEQFAAHRAGATIGVTQVMTRPVPTVHPETCLADAAHLMVSERISGLPVVDDTDRLVGIISEADFLRALGVPAHHPSHSLWQTLDALFRHLAEHPHLEAPEQLVGPSMTEAVVTVAPEGGAGDVIALMKRHRVKRVVVCDAQRRVLGMVTRSDLVRVFFDRYRHD
jgi:CBS-domain-containing membrane protein